MGQRRNGSALVRVTVAENKKAFDNGYREKIVICLAGTEHREPW